MRVGACNVLYFYINYVGVCVYVNACTNYKPNLCFGLIVKKNNISITVFGDS